MHSLVSRCHALLLVLMVLSIGGLASQAFAQATPEASLEAAISHFNRARQGDADQLEPAIAAFRATPATPALQPLSSVYLGSAITLKGKAARLPWNKMKFTYQGLDSIDQALAALRPEHDRVLVQGTPLSLVTRVVAAATFIAVPDGIFHRRASGKALLAELRRSPLPAATPAAFRAELGAVEASLKESEK
ncbi:MAG: hypothetical protein NTX56_19205 [Proteobacteria bacterium]|nr:hypothetical protein [Pseudomonadota bacterium]